MLHNFTEEQIEEMREAATLVVSGFDENTDVVSIMMKLYTKAFPDANAEEVEKIACEILNTVTTFSVDFKDACTDVNTFIRNYQKRLDQDMSDFEKCRYWYEFAAALTAATLGADADDETAKKLQKQLGAMHLDEQHASRVYVDFYRDMALEALRNSNLLTQSLVLHSEWMEYIAEGNEAARLLVQYGENEIDFRAVFSMLSYIVALQEDSDEEITPAQMAISVCTNLEETQILTALRNNDMSLESAAYALSILEDTALLLLFSVGGFVASLSVFLIHIPVLPVIIFYVWNIVNMGYFIETLESFGSGPYKESYAVVIKARETAQFAKKLYHYLADYVVPKNKLRAENRLKELNDRMLSNLSEKEMRQLEENNPL